jgi:hypothetical protein
MTANGLVFGSECFGGDCCLNLHRRSVFYPDDGGSVILPFCHPLELFLFIYFLCNIFKLRSCRPLRHIAGVHKSRTPAPLVELILYRGAQYLRILSTLLASFQHPGA